GTTTLVVVPLLCSVSLMLGCGYFGTIALVVVPLSLLEYRELVSSGNFLDWVGVFSGGLDSDCCLSDYGIKSGNFLDWVGVFSGGLEADGCLSDYGIRR
ncbi:hypothetical protein L195_g030693, partial [Trifolium pratense]